MEEKLLKTASCNENTVKVTCKMQEISPCFDVWLGKQHGLYILYQQLLTSTTRLCPL